MTERDAIAVGNFAGREAEARALCARLAQEPAEVINASGDRVMRAGDQMLISLARTETTPAFDMVSETNYRPMPDYMLRAIATMAQCVRDQMLVADKRH